MQLTLHDLPYLGLVQYQGKIHAVVSPLRGRVTLHNGSVLTLAQLDHIIPITEEAPSALGFDLIDADRWAFSTPDPPPDCAIELTPVEVSVSLYHGGPPIVDFPDQDDVFGTVTVAVECEYVHELPQAVWRNCRHWLLPAYFAHLR